MDAHGPVDATAVNADEDPVHDGGPGGVLGSKVHNRNKPYWQRLTSAQAGEDLGYVRLGRIERHCRGLSENNSSY